MPPNQSRDRPKPKGNISEVPRPRPILKKDKLVEPTKLDKKRKKDEIIAQLKELIKRVKTQEEYSPDQIKSKSQETIDNFNENNEHEQKLESLTVKSEAELETFVTNIFELFGEAEDVPVETNSKKSNKKKEKDVRKSQLKELIKKVKTQEEYSPDQIKSKSQETINNFNENNEQKLESLRVKSEAEFKAIVTNILEVFGKVEELPLDDNPKKPKIPKKKKPLLIQKIDENGNLTQLPTNSITDADKKGVTDDINQFLAIRDTNINNSKTDVVQNPDLLAVDCLQLFDNTNLIDEIKKQPTIENVTELSVAIQTGLNHLHQLGRNIMTLQTIGLITKKNNIQISILPLEKMLEQYNDLNKLLNKSQSMLADIMTKINGYNAGYNGPIHNLVEYTRDYFTPNYLYNQSIILSMNDSESDIKKNEIGDRAEAGISSMLSVLPGVVAVMIGQKWSNMDTHKKTKMDSIVATSEIPMSDEDAARLPVLLYELADDAYRESLLSGHIGLNIDHRAQSTYQPDNIKILEIELSKTTEKRDDLIGMTKHYHNMMYDHAITIFEHSDNIENSEIVDKYKIKIGSTKNKIYQNSREITNKNKFIQTKEKANQDLNVQFNEEKQNLLELISKNSKDSEDKDKIIELENKLSAIKEKINDNKKLILKTKKEIIPFENQNNNLYSVIKESTVKAMEELNPSSENKGYQYIINQNKKFIDKLLENIEANKVAIETDNQLIKELTYEIEEINETYSPTGFSTPLDLGPSNRASVYQNGMLIEDNTINADVPITEEELTLKRENIRLKRIELNEIINWYKIRFTAVQVKNNVNRSNVQEHIESGKYSGAIGYSQKQSLKNPVSHSDANQMSLNMDNIPETVSKLFS
jgi:hypothetical protein